MGLNEAELQVLKDNGWDSFATLAFARNHVPGQTDDSAFLSLCELVFDSTPPPQDRVPLMRRLYFESYTLAAADMRRRVDGGADDVVKRLPPPERAARYEDQKRRLIGVDLTGELDVSHQLLDLVVAMHEDDVLRYVDISACTKRDQELRGVKVDTVIRSAGDGTIKLSKEDAALCAEVGTDLRVKYALTRRSLAFDQAKLITFALMETWSEAILKVYLADPPPGYHRTSLAQIFRADAEMFRRMQELTRSGIRMNGVGTLPLDQAIMTASKDISVVFCMLPLAQGASSQGQQPASQGQRPAAQGSSQSLPVSKKQLKRQAAQARTAAKPATAPPAAKPAKSKGKGKEGNMPTELIGQANRNAAGEPLCYAFNIQGRGCPDADDGEKCRRGWHQCCKPGCFKKHPFFEHV